jgi:maltose alpha-D-glucosyltransferase/alpha-amylase
MRIRCHGDYHLGQVLHTGNDFVMTDFEGEPARSLSERRIKRCPLLDVAGMIRSFHYAAYNALFGDASVVRRDDVAVLEPWAQFWYVWTSVAFLKGYLQRADKASFLPADKTQLHILLDAFMIDKAIYEIGYEIDNRPNWLMVPLRGILQLLQDPPSVNSPSP